MAIPADGRGFWLRHRARPHVLCASCGSRFDADSATTGARVRCPLCAEVVELTNVIAEKRRYRSRTSLEFSDPRQRPRRRRSTRTAVSLCLLAIACGVYFVWWWLYPIHPR